MDVYDNLKDGEGAGTLIVGRYNKEGKVQQKSTFSGSPEDLADLAEKYKNSMSVARAEFLPSLAKIPFSLSSNTPKPKIQKKRGPKPKIKVVQEIQPPTNVAKVNPNKVFDLDTNDYFNEDSTKTTGTINFEEPEEYGHNEEPSTAQQITQKRIAFQNQFGKIFTEVEDVIYQENGFSIMLVYTNINKLTFIPKEGDNDANKQIKLLFVYFFLISFESKILYTYVVFNKNKNF